MRIIAGEFRGRKLLPPASEVTRPITDRAKQSLFDILAPLIDGAIVYDCFAGTGSMGLESASRGASHVTFFEREPSAVKRLKQNIQTLGVGAITKVISGDLFSWFAQKKAEGGRADLVFFDPPYRFVHERADSIQKVICNIVENHLSDTGTVIFRHDSADHLELDELTRYDQREYGQMMIELLRPRE